MSKHKHKDDHKKKHGKKAVVSAKAAPVIGSAQ